MRERKREKPRRLDPKRIADGANRGFVKLAQSLMCLITWRTAGTKPAVKMPRSRPARGGSAPDPRFFASLAKRVERILNHVHRAGEESDDKTFQLKLRDLFHGDAGRRLAAVRWIRKRRFRQALSTLESVRSIEESVEVRDEIARAILEIKGCLSNDRGGVRCTSF